MLAPLLDAMTLRISLYVCAALLALSIGLGIGLRVVMLQRDVAVADNQMLATKLDMQNAAVEKWQKEAATQAQLTAAAVVEAGKVQVITNERVERIMAAPVPTACPDAVQWGALQGAKQAADWEGKR